MRLKDKIIIITGSTTGIGQAIAECCVSEGASVLIHGRNAEAGEALVDTFGKAAAFCQADLADPEAPRKIIDSALEHFGRIDGLVNNAALVPKGNIEDTDLALWQRIHAINLQAPFLLIKYALGELQKSHGCVVNIGSINAYAGEPDLFAYSVSKGGLTTLTRNLGDSLHMNHGVRVNQVNPGWTLTEQEIKKKQEHGLPPDWYKRVPREFAPSGSIIPPEAIAACVLYFLGDESRPISGSVVDLEQFPVIGRNPPKGQES
jgi:NAD(P)-dependent dehydrogenase (short-subunit alcohol dehydrogenase family)